MKQNSVIKGKWEPTTRGISPFPVTCSLHAIYFLLYDVLGKWNHLTTALILSRQEPFRVSLLFIIHSLVGVAVWEVLFAGVSAGARTSPAGACREVTTGCPRDVQDAAFKATLRTLTPEPQTFGTTGQSATCSDTSTFKGSSISTESGNHLFWVFVCQYPLNTQVAVPWSRTFVLNTRSKGLLCPRRVSTFTLIRYFIS